MRILHTMLRVGDLPRSIDFYTNVLGMKLLRTTDRPEQKYTLAFVGYGDESRAARCSSSRTTTASTATTSAPRYGHVAIEVDDAAAACDAVRAKGGNGHARGRAGEGRHDGDRVRRRTRTATRSS